MRIRGDLMSVDISKSLVSNYIQLAGNAHLQRVIKSMITMNLKQHRRRRRTHQCVV